MHTVSSPTPRLFNSAAECGLRLLFVLDRAARELDLQRLVTCDYLLIYSGDVQGPVSLHPPVPHRGAEWIVKRDVVRSGLDLMFSRELLAKHATRAGFYYSSSRLTAPFLALLTSAYSNALRKRSEWLVATFDRMNDEDLEAFMTAHIGEWGAEFDQAWSLKRLVL